MTSSTFFSAGERIYIDSVVFIYYVENKTPYADMLKSLFEAIERRRVNAYTSTVTITEVLTLPKREKKDALVKAFRTFVAQYITVIPLDFDIADAAATLRARYPNLHTPDAFHLATALTTRCNRILTNDQNLTVLSSPLGIPVTLLSSSSL